MRYVLSVIICVISLFLPAVASSEPLSVMPHSEFIEMTQNLFVALDMLEAALDGAPIERQIEEAQIELNAATSTFDRFKEEERTEEQNEILREISLSESNFHLCIEMWKTYGTFPEGDMKKAQQKASDARSLFIEYITETNKPFDPKQLGMAQL